VQVPPGKKSAVPYVASIAPPTLLALSFPDIFFKALDYAGTYGVLLLFGIMPAAMAWSERCVIVYSNGAH
jgi:tyrosine-specific transport protein